MATSSTTNANSPWRTKKGPFYPNPNPAFIDYDRNCIKQIRDEFTNYILTHGAPPEVVTIGPYEMQEVNKAKEAGIKMAVTVNEIQYPINIWDPSK